MSHLTGRARLARAALAPALACALALPLASPPGPLAAQEAASAVQDVTLTDVVLPLGTTLLRAPRITVSGTRLSRDELTALLRADSPEPWPARLARLEAASITAPVFVAEHGGSGPVRQSVTYREVTLRDVRGGRVAELTSAGAALTVTSDKETGSGTYGRIQATDLDLAALTRLYGVSGDGRGAVQRVYATVQVADVIYTDRTGTTLKLGRLEARDLGGRQIPGGWSGAFDALDAGMVALAAEGDLAPPERAKLAGAAADLIEGAALGSMEARDVSLSETESDGPLLIEVARISTAAPPEAGLILEGLAYTQGESRARLGRLALSGVSLAPTVATLRRLAKPEAAVEEEDLRRLAPALGALTLQALTLDLPAAKGPDAPGIADPKAPAAGDPMIGPGVTARPALPTPNPTPTKPGAAAPVTHVALQDAALSFGPLQDGIPTATRLSLSGLVLPAAAVAGAPVLGALPGYGYADLDLAVVADMAWDAGKREVSLREVSLSGRDMGTLRLAGTVGGIGPEIFDGRLPASQLLMFTATAKALDLTVENTGLFERFIATQSKALSLKPEELRQEYVAASQFGVPVILGNSAGAKAIGAAMGQFVQKPGRLTLRAKARTEAGLGFSDFALAHSPAALLDKVDVEAKSD